jgi:hypothetical protein
VSARVTSAYIWNFTQRRLVVVIDVSGQPIGSTSKDFVGGTAKLYRISAMNYHFMLCNLPEELSFTPLREPEVTHDQECCCLFLFTDCVTHRVGQVIEPRRVTEGQVLLMHVLLNAFVCLFVCLFVMSGCTNTDVGSH